MKKAIVGQSGGPTVAINASLAGVYTQAKEIGIETVYGMCYGIEGLLKENYIDLSEKFKDEIDIELLKRTPSSYLGSCRYKLPDIDMSKEVYERLFSILEKLDIGYFFYIGGNDSMDTTKKLSEYAVHMGSDIRFIGIPKTIDNDLVMTDHTPGFGSAAKFIASTMKEIIRDSTVYDMESVTIVEIMGRNAGWLAGAAALAKGEDCIGVDAIYLPEVPFDISYFLEIIKNKIKEKKSLVIAVSEGIKDVDGHYICETGATVDNFGHVMLSGTAMVLADLVKKHLGIKARAIEFSTLQRCAAHLASGVDINESFMAGMAGVRAAYAGESGKMVIYVRTSDTPYRCVTDTCDVACIANAEKNIPREWINEAGDGVTSDFITYVKPLIQGEVTNFITSGMPRHLL